MLTAEALVTPCIDLTADNANSDGAALFQNRFVDQASDGGVLLLRAGGTAGAWLA